MSNQVTNPSDHDEIVSMLPWFVNRTLSGHDRKVVKTHIEHCDECQREIQFLEALSDVVQTDARSQYDAHADVDKNLASVMDRIDAQEKHSSAGNSAAAWLQQKFGEVFSFAMGQPFPQWGATALAGVLVAVLGFQLYSTQVDDDYSVLSSPDIRNPSTRLSVEMTAAGSQESTRSAIEREAENIGQAIDIQINTNGTYIVVFTGPVGVSELSGFVNALEEEAQIERVEILP